MMRKVDFVKEEEIIVLLVYEVETAVNYLFLVLHETLRRTYEKVRYLDCIGVRTVYEIDTLYIIGRVLYITNVDKDFVFIGADFL